MTLAPPRLKLYSNPRSPYSRKVRVLAHEAGLYDQLDVEICEPVTDPNGPVRVNPLGQVPTLILPSGIPLFDSDVISLYLDELAPFPRVPRPLPAVPGAPLSSVWMRLRHMALASGVMDATVLIVRERMRPAERQSKEWIDEQISIIRDGVAQLENETPAVSATITIDFEYAAISRACALGYLDFRLPDYQWRSGHPKLATWFAEVSNRSSMLATQPPAAQPK